MFPRPSQRLKSAPKLYEAIEAKLRAQREFVMWWDAQEKDKGGGDVRNPRRRSMTGIVKAGTVLIRTPGGGD